MLEATHDEKNILPKLCRQGLGTALERFCDSHVLKLAPSEVNARQLKEDAFGMCNASKECHSSMWWTATDISLAGPSRQRGTPKLLPL